MKQKLLSFVLALSGAVMAHAEAANSMWDVTNVGTGLYNEVSSWVLGFSPRVAADALPANGWRANFVQYGMTEAYTKFQDYRMTFPEGGLSENSVSHMRGLWEGKSLTYDTTGTWWLKSPGFINAATGNSNYPLLFSMNHTEGLNFFRVNSAGASSEQYGFLLSNAVLTVSYPSGKDGLQQVDFSQGFFNWYDPMGYETSPNNTLEIGYQSGTTPVEVNFHPGTESRGRYLSVARRNLNILGGSHKMLGAVKVGAGSISDLVTEPTLRVSDGTFTASAGLWIGAIASHPGARVIVDGDGRLVANEIDLVREQDAKSYLDLAGDAQAEVGTMVVGYKSHYDDAEFTPWGEMTISNNATLAVSTAMTVGSGTGGQLTLADNAKLNMGEGVVLNIGTSVPGKVVAGGHSEINLADVGVFLHSANGVNGTAELILKDHAKLTCSGKDSDKIRVGHYQGAGNRLLVRDDAVIDASDATPTLYGTNTIMELAGGNTHFKNLYVYGAAKEGQVCGLVISGGRHIAEGVVYAANGTDSHGFVRITGGTLEFANNNGDLKVNSGATASYGRIELLGGTVVGRVRRSGYTTWSGSASFHADGGTIKVRNSSTFRSVENFETATLGATGLFVDTAGFDAHLDQEFTDAAGVTGRLTKKGAGTLYAHRASAHGETLLIGGTFAPTNGIDRFGRSIAVTGGAMLSLTSNEGAGFSAGSVTLGDTSSRGTLVMGAGDVLTLTEDDAFAAPNGLLTYAPAAENGTYTVFRCKGTVDLGAFNRLTVNGVKAGSRYEFVAEPDNADTLVKLRVYEPVPAMDNEWSGTDGNWSSGSNWSDGSPSSSHAAVFTAEKGCKTVTVSDGVAVDSLRFTGGDYTISGAGSISAYSLSALAGSDVIGTSFIPIGTFAIDISAGASLELSGAMSGGRASLVSKTGSGALTLSGDNASLFTDWSLAGGRTSVSVPEDFGAGSSSAELTIGPATLTVLGEGEMERKVTLDAGASKAAIADIRADVTVKGVLTAASGGFVKRGAGALTVCYPKVASAVTYYPCRDMLSLPGGDYRPSTRSKPIAFDDSGDFTPVMTNGLGGLNVLAGTLRLVGQSKVEGADPYTSFVQNYWTIVGGEWADAEANAELELSCVTWKNNSNYSRFALGVKVPAGAPNHPTLRVIDGSYMKPHGIFLGDTDQGQDVYPTLAVTNATVEIPYHLYVGPLNQPAALNHPTIRIGAAGRVKCTYATSDRRNLLLGENCDVMVADGGILETVVSPSGVTFGQYASGAVRVMNGGILRTCRFQSITQTALANTNLTVAFDGGVMEMIGADEVSKVHSPANWRFATVGDGLELKAGADVKHTFTLPFDGEGGVVKTGAGEIVLAKGAKVVSDQPVDSGLVTANWSGLTEVREGTLTICAGAARTDLAVRVSADAVLDLAGETVTLGEISGSGLVRNGTIRCTISIPFGASDERELPEFGTVAVSHVTVDFNAGGDQSVALGTVIPVARWTGGSAFNARAWKGVNLGKDVSAQFSLVDGVVLATAVPKPGVILIVR